MDILTAVLLGIVQGFTEFLPVSSSGHLVILEKAAGLSVDAITFHAFLHSGTLIAVLLSFSSDFEKLWHELKDLARYGAVRLRSYLSVGEAHTADPHRMPMTNYRRMALMILISVIPAALFGALLAGPAEAMSGSLFQNGIAFLITGIFLMVTQMIPPGNEMPRDIPDRYAWIVGLLEGFSVLPGLSGSAMTIGAGILAGMNRRTAIRFSYLCSAPVMALSLLYGIFRGVSGGFLEGRFLLMCLAGMAASAVTGTLMIKQLLNFVRRKGTGIFAGYCFAAGALSIALFYFL